MDEIINLEAEENKLNETEANDNPAEIENNYNGKESIIEKVRELNNVKYYFALSGNSPENTSEALNAFQQRLLLITGGNDENMSYDLLGDALVSKVKHLILIGSTSGLIEMSLMRKLIGKHQGIDIRITHCSTLRQAVNCAYLSSKPDDSVLLSPASNCISELYDELKEIYIKYVDAL